jgi:hypothetical protein
MAKVIVIDGGPSLVDLGKAFTLENCMEYVGHKPIPEEDKGGDDATDETVDFMNGQVVISLYDYDGKVITIIGSVEDYIK